MHVGREKLGRVLGFKNYIEKGSELVFKNNMELEFKIMANQKFKTLIYSNPELVEGSYYLYVDAVSHYNKVIEKYEVSDKAHTSMRISFEDKYGYLEINELEDGKYFIEIMYNYAKIEVIVREIDVKVVVSNSLSILSSIDFNNDVLKNLLDEEVSQFSEFEIDIFETVTTTDSQYLGTVEEKEDDDEEEIYDSDYIN